MDWLTLSRIKCGDGSILRMSFDSLLVSSTVAYYKMMHDVIMARLNRDDYRGHRLSGFPEIGHVTFGLPGRIVGIVFSMLLLLFTPTLYIILAGDNVSRLLGSAGVVVSRKACTWIVSAIVGFPFALVRTMRDVSFMR